MDITKELLLARRENLKKEKDQLIANANAFEGAIQDVDHWLSVLEKDQLHLAENKDAEVR